jgi:hypothetical protein
MMVKFKFPLHLYTHILETLTSLTKNGNIGLKIILLLAAYLKDG